MPICAGEVNATVMVRMDGATIASLMRKETIALLLMRSELIEGELLLRRTGEVEVVRREIFAGSVSVIVLLDGIEMGIVRDIDRVVGEETIRAAGDRVSRALVMPVNVVFIAGEAYSTRLLGSVS